MDNNIRIIKLPAIVSPENVAEIVRSLNIKRKTYLSQVLRNSSIGEQ